jgi:mRNA-degrading endonuclease RelE of RelBE toxin-antitoxin system
MNGEEDQPQRPTIVWAPEARGNLRAIDRETALQILHCLDRYLVRRDGDVKKLKPPRTGFRLRCGDYRLFFDLAGHDTLHISAVLHRRDAYR